MSAAHDYLSANREYFDKQALTIDDRPNAQEQPRRIGNAIRRKYGSLFDEETTTLMDFACGTGAIFIGSMLGESYRSEFEPRQGQYLGTYVRT